jgi:hypothetical protein
LRKNFKGEIKMELAFIVWMIGVIPSVSALFIFVGGMLSAFACFGILVGACENEPSVVKTCKKILMFSAPAVVLGVMLPNKETTYAMAAAYGVQTVVENPKAQELASDGVDVLKALMSKAKKELEKEEK